MALKSLRLCELLVLRWFDPNEKGGPADKNLARLTLVEDTCANQRDSHAWGTKRGGQSRCHPPAALVPILARMETHDQGHEEST